MTEPQPEMTTKKAEGHTIPIKPGTLLTYAFLCMHVFRVTAIKESVSAVTYTEKTHFNKHLFFFRPGNDT